MSLPADVTQLIAALPGQLQESATLFFERLLEERELPPADVLPSLVRVVACSEFAARSLLRDQAQLIHRLAGFDAPISAAELDEFVRDFAAAGHTPATAKTMLRRQRNYLLTRIFWRDICAGADVAETLESLSTVADSLIDAACRYAAQQMEERFGVVRDHDNTVVQLLVLGMGKLGGRELNFSSDIDIIFAYSEDGSSDGSRELAAQQYFDRMSRLVVSLLDEMTADGFVYRTDTRLRPFGDSGPPVVSFAALESYLVKHGRDWERYAYVKARLVGPQPPKNVHRELFDDLITPFVYRRYLDYGVFESLRDMHRMISAEVRKRELADNVKLGPGGIREIEFIVQTLQLVRGGSNKGLQTPSLRVVLPLLVNEKGLDAGAAAELADAYAFLRKLENCIQAIRDAQTHELPTDSVDRERLCLAMNLPSWEALIKVLEQHRDAVSRLFNEITFGDVEKASEVPFRQKVVDFWTSDAPTTSLQRHLEHAGVADADSIAAQITTFRDAPTTKKISIAASERLQTFVPRLLRLAADCEHPARAITRCLSVIEQVLRRSAYLALLNENRLAAKRLVRLCEKSAYIAGELARYPVLLDELLDPRLLAEPVSKADLLSELRARSDDDIEAAMERLARFQRSHMFRVAVADFNDALPIMKVSDSLTFLAEAILEFALAVAWQDLVRRHGVPCYTLDGTRHEAGFAIIGYGKLGGLELSYGSDLDIVFLHDSVGEEQETNGDKPLDNSLFYSRLVRRLVHILTTRTSTGELYEIDTRLRPSGRKGLLVTSAEAFDRYQQDNAWTWEHQALLRARPVAGSAELASSFDRIRVETLTRRVRLASLRTDVTEMRERMRKELDRSNDHQFDLKHGRGGIGDIEFIVQYLVLKNAVDHPEVIEFTDNIRQLDALASCRVITPKAAVALQDIYRAYRRRQHHLVLNNEPVVLPPKEFSAERAAVVQHWDEAFGD